MQVRYTLKCNRVLHGSSLVAQIKDLALSQRRLGWLLRHGFDPRPGEIPHAAGVAKGKKSLIYFKILTSEFQLRTTESEFVFQQATQKHYSHCMMLNNSNLLSLLSLSIALRMTFRKHASRPSPSTTFSVHIGQTFSQVNNQE